MTKLNIGCGNTKLEGFTGIDISPDCGADIVHDVRITPWPFEDASVEEIYCSHFFEHLTGAERMAFMNEAYRVLKPEAKMVIITPHWTSVRSVQDPTHCFSEDTEILTDNGFKLIKNVKIGENVLTMNIKDKSTKYSPCLNVINEPYVGNMLSFKTKRLDIMVTPNHDMIWQAGGKYDGRFNKSPSIEFLNLKGHHSRRGISTVDWVGESPEYITIPSQKLHHKTNLPTKFKASIFCEFMGWYLSEGHVDLSSKGRYRISISQSSEVNSKKVKEIVSCIKAMGFSPCVKHDRVVFSSKELANYLIKFGLSGEKFIPNEIKMLNPNLLKIFLSSAIKGDGRKNNKGFEYATTSKKLASDINEVALKAGYRSSLRVEKRNGTVTIFNRLCNQKTELYLVGICDPKPIYYPKPTQVMYSGNQVCVTTKDNNIILVRRNGFAIWSGNCWPPVAENTYLYFNKKWREDNKLTHYPITCDFDFGYGYMLDGDIQVRNIEFQQFAIKHYNNAVNDLYVTLTRRA